MIFLPVCVSVIVKTKQNKNRKEEQILLMAEKDVLLSLIMLPLELMAGLLLLLWKQFQSLGDDKPVPEIQKNDYLILSALLYLGKHLPSMMP